MTSHTVGMEDHSEPCTAAIGSKRRLSLYTATVDTHEYITDSPRPSKRSKEDGTKISGKTPFLDLIPAGYI